ncbi:MAG: histidine kinase [Ferruginibacter sp.]|nr:histidine kinase [Ferruginibacter sp.]
MKYLLITIQLLLSHIAFCQNVESNIINYTKENGLPSNETYCVFKDSKGYIWVGTDRGVVRYNGLKFQKFELPDNVVFKIKEDDDGKIWFFTYSNKISYYYKGQISAYPYNNILESHLNNFLLSNAYIYDNKDIYLKSISENDYLINSLGHIEKIDNGLISTKHSDTIILSKHNQKEIATILKSYRRGSYNNLTFIVDKLNNKKFSFKHDSLFSERYTESYIANNGNVYLFQNNVLCKIFKNGKSFLTKNLRCKIRSILYDEEYKLLLAGTLNNGVYVLDENLEIISQNLLEKKTITSFCLGDNNSYWVSTLNDGVFRLKSIISDLPTSHFSTNTSLNSLLVYKDSILLFGDNKGINISNKKGSSLVYRDNNTKETFLKSLNNTLLWAATRENNQGFIGSKIKLKKIEDLIILNIQHNKDVSILCDSSLVTHVYSSINIISRQKNTTPIENFNASMQFQYNNFYVTTIFADSLKIRCINPISCTEILLGTLNNLYTLDLKNYKIRRYNDNEQILKSGVNYISKDENENIFIALRFGGLAILKGRKLIAHVSEKQGLLNNSIRYIHVDSNKLWLATDNGISAITFHSFSPVKYTIKNFGKEVGLGNEIIYQIIRFKKDILAATSKGIFKLANADSLLAIPPKPIPFYLTTISTHLGDTSNITSISLPHNKNRISINFDAIEFTTPNDIEYYYRIVNTDSTWFNVSNPQLILQDLSPGKYNIEIKAMLPKQSRASEIKTITLIIEKPWWQKTTSLIVFALLLGSMFYAYTNWRIKKAKKVVAEKNEIANKMLKLEQNALQAQMNPHFIFNCLTGIQQLMNTNNIDEANEYLVTFQD